MCKIWWYFLPRNKLDGSDEFYINFLRIYKVTFRKISIFVAAVHWGWAMDCPIFFSTLVLRFPLFLFNIPPLAERDYLQFSQRLCFFNFFCFLFVFLLFFKHFSWDLITYLTSLGHEIQHHILICHIIWNSRLSGGVEDLYVEPPDL